MRSPAWSQFRPTPSRTTCHRSQTRRTSLTSTRNLIGGDDAAAPPPSGSKLADVAKSASIKAERALMKRRSTTCTGIGRRAAEQLGVSYKTLLNKIKECGHLT